MSQSGIERQHSFLFLRLAASGCLLAVVGAGALAVGVLAARNTTYCSNTQYGHGVTCINGAGAGGSDAYITSRTVSYRPGVNHAIIVAAYTCADSKCQEMPVTTLSIGDNINSPEPCFIPSPHSPFALNEISKGHQKLQEYIWVCPTIPKRVTSFTATCSRANACSYITLTITEWTGLASTNVFEADGGAASQQQQTRATVSTSSRTKSLYDLLYTFMDNTGDENMSPVPPFVTALQFYPGNINTAAIATTNGIQTAQTTWTGKDDWYGAMAAIRSAAHEQEANQQ